MGVNADITVYGWRKPTLELELVEGGSLAPNTTYYVCGVMGMTPRTYCSIGSEPSDTYDITTTTTALSIKITQKTYRDITSFSDNGDSRTLIESDRHCFTVGDELKIESGSYTGTWTVDEWVDYNNFIIDTSYIDNVPVQCYSDTQDYNQPSGLERASGMAYYVHTVPPSYLTNRWTRAAYQTYNIENPTTITAVPTSNFGDYNGVPEVSGLSGGMYNSLLGYGTPYVDVIGTVTASAIEAEFIEAGFPYHCGVSTQGYGSSPQFNLMAAIRFNTNGAMSLNNAVIILGGEFEVKTDNNVQFNHCVINVPTSTFTGYFEFTATQSVFFNASNTNTTGGWILGDNNRIYAVPRFGAYGDDVGSYNDQYSGGTKNYGIVRNKDFRPLYNNAETMQVSYAATAFENCTLFPIYMPTQPGTSGIYPDIYMMENCYIAETAYAWHFRMYAYGNTPPIRFDYLNVDTDHVDNVKKVINNGAGNYRMYFYRRLEFYVQDNGISLQNVTVSIEDNAANQYSDTTDENGYVYIDVLEQFTSIDVADGTHNNWNSDHDTYYDTFSIIFSLTGYYDETLVLEDGYGNELNNISLVEIPPPEPEPLRLVGLKVD